MANPLFNQLANNIPMSKFMQEFNQFKQTINGNPQQMVQQMLNDGRMSQQQFNQLSQQANAIMQMFGNK